MVTWWLERILPSQRRLAPFARTLFDVPLPGDGVFDDVERLARNLVAMNGILRDRSRTSIRLVMNPDRMVVKEAMRTFTYLNLYGYLTDAVVVNRLLPEREGYFAAWSEVQQRAARARALGLRARAGARPRPTSSARWWAPRCSTGWPTRCSASSDPAALLHSELAQELVTDNGRATPAGAASRSPSKGDLELKKIGLEVIVRVGRQKRTIMLPPALAAYSTSGARFEDGALEIVFEKQLPQCEHLSRLRDDDEAEPPPPPPPHGRSSTRSPLFVLLDGMRRAAPRELQDQVTSLIREFLLTLRSLIDWYLERLDRPRREPRGRGHPDRLMSLDYASLPPDLPVPEDDGAADHLTGMKLPSLDAAGGRRAAASTCARRPRSARSSRSSTRARARPAQPLVPGWDDIPGARGCTPQSCAFRDRHGALADLGATRRRASARWTPPSRPPSPSASSFPTRCSTTGPGAARRARPADLRRARHDALQASHLRGPRTAGSRRSSTRSSRRTATRPRSRLAAQGYLKRGRPLGPASRLM